MGSSMSVVETLREASRGDLIEIQRLGYKHWGVYVGSGYIVHVTLEGGKNGKIKRERLVDVCGGSKCRVNNLENLAERKGLNPKSRDNIVRTAEGKIGDQIEYELAGNNCECFSTECRYGQAFSAQVDRVVGAAGTQTMTMAALDRCDWSEEDKVDFLLDREWYFPGT